MNKQNKKNAWLPGLSINCKALVIMPLTALLLAGCEAALNLQGVEKTKSQDVRRTDQFLGVAFNQQAQVAIGSDGLILSRPLSATKDAWQRQQLTGAPPLVDVATCGDQSFVALSLDKQVWRSQDNGESWSAVSLPTLEDMLAITCTQANHIWVVGSFSTLLHSTDQGATWQEQTLDEDAMITNIQFLDANTAFIAGEFGLVARTDDGGETWNPLDYIPNDFYVHSALFLSPEEGWVAGLSGKILRTEDGGLNWNTVPTPVSSPLYGFYQAEDRLFAFGDHATVLEWVDGEWQRLANPNPPVYLRDAEMLANGDLLLVGGFGSLYPLDVAPVEQDQLTQQ